MYPSAEAELKALAECWRVRIKKDILTEELQLAIRRKDNCSPRHTLRRHRYHIDIIVFEWLVEDAVKKLQVLVDTFIQHTSYVSWYPHHILYGPDMLPYLREHYF